MRRLTTKTEKKLDSVFESMEPLFGKMAETLDSALGDEDGEEEEKEDPDCCAMADGVVSITANNGHVVIEGELKSLRINGTDISL
jgi:hypothetical protein